MASVAITGARADVERAPHPVPVAMVYGDPVVGRALATLIQGLGYDVRPIGQSYLDDPEEARMLLEGVRALVLAPGVGPYLRTDFSELLQRNPSTANIQVVDLNLSSQGGTARADHRLPWPVRTEDLRRHIEDALADGYADSYKPLRQPPQAPEEKEEAP